MVGLELRNPTGLLKFLRQSPSNNVFDHGYAEDTSHIAQPAGKPQAYSSPWKRYTPQENQIFAYVKKKKDADQLCSYCTTD